MATPHPTKSTTPVPERTEEDNQRLFQLYKGWTLTEERDGQEVSRSDTWTDMLKKVQAVKSQLSDNAQLKKHRPVRVMVDNTTRWLSQFSMIKHALVLRPFYNSFIQRASNEWEKVNLTRAGHIKKGSKLPFFLEEENRMTADN
ncbi:hypothetical protein RAB80_017212 [Fusarium oxysporum f. sp. vasinfectum]|nr:hypothetical protein RAB80_017212 [Fusarium oxysporum f. sp. vasinfectum]